MPSRQPLHFTRVSQPLSNVGGPPADTNTLVYVGVGTVLQSKVHTLYPRFGELLTRLIGGLATKGAEKFNYVPRAVQLPTSTSFTS